MKQKAKQIFERYKKHFGYEDYSFDEFMEEAKPDLDRVELYLVAQDDIDEMDETERGYFDGSVGDWAWDDGEFLCSKSVVDDWRDQAWSEKRFDDYIIYELVLELFKEKE